jgi:orotate phosphoribosyltransferase
MIDELRRSGLLDETDARRFVRTGHFAYEGGDHGDTWLALELLFADPRRLRRAARRLAGRLGDHEADLVCGPLVGGALVGQWVAHALGVGFVYVEPRPSGGYAIPAALRPTVDGRRVVVVDDVINAASATQATVREIESLGGRVVVVGCLIVRESMAAEIRPRLGVPVEALVAMSWNTWPASRCPLCAERAGLTNAP